LTLADKRPTWSFVKLTSASVGVLSARPPAAVTGMAFPSAAIASCQPSQLSGPADTGR
jgi:hypothetical protein